MTQHLLSFQPREPDEISAKLKEADIKAESSMAAAVEWGSKPHRPLVMNSATELTERVSSLCLYEVEYLVEGTAVAMCWVLLDVIKGCKISTVGECACCE